MQQQTTFLYQIAQSMHFFWIALFGTLMLMLSFLFSGHDEFDHDLDHDHDMDHDGDHSGNMSILSFKVLWMFIVGFGAGGYFAANAKCTVLVSSLWGLFAGVLMGAIGYALINFLYKRQGNSVVKTEFAVGQTAYVDTTIPSGGVGEVRCVVDGHSEYFRAITKASAPIPTGSAVLVVEATAGGVLVVEKVG